MSVCWCRYHGNVGKDDGQRLYQEFVTLCDVCKSHGVIHIAIESCICLTVERSHKKQNICRQSVPTGTSRSAAAVCMKGCSRFYWLSYAFAIGTYGNRQVLSVVTNGPFTHLFEFWCNYCTLMHHFHINYRMTGIQQASTNIVLYLTAVIQ